MARKLLLDALAWAVGIVLAMNASRCVRHHQSQVEHNPPVMVAR